jgi:hypothetical protein
MVTWGTNGALSDPLPAGRARPIERPRHRFHQTLEILEMIRLSKICLATAIVAVVAPLAAAHAQMDTQNTSRFAVEPYLAEYSFDNGGSNSGRTGIGGFGVRVMFGHSDATKTLSTFFNRARAGAFVTYTSEQKYYSTTHFGVQGDFPLFAAPTNGGWLDPFVSVGAGVFHTAINRAVFGNSLPAGFNPTQNKFALTPAVGTLIPIAGQIKFRGDLRDVVVFGDNTTQNFVAEGGISIGF